MFFTLIPVGTLPSVAHLWQEVISIFGGGVVFFLIFMSQSVLCDWAIFLRFCLKQNRQTKTSLKTTFLFGSVLIVAGNAYSFKCRMYNRLLLEPCQNNFPNRNSLRIKENIIYRGLFCISSSSNQDSSFYPRTHQKYIKKQKLDWSV